MPGDSRQSEVRDELTDATNLEIPKQFLRKSRWMSVVKRKLLKFLRNLRKLGLR